MRWRIRVTLLGRADRSLRSLLDDVFRDLSIELELVGQRGDERVAAEPVDVVFAVVHRGDVHDVMDMARRVAHGAPILAVLPIAEDRLVEQSRRLGARACARLDASLDVLRQTFLELLCEPRRPHPRPARQQQFLRLLLAQPGRT